MLRESSKEELALLIALYTGGAQDEKTLGQTLQQRPARISDALRYLVEAGLVQRAEDGIVTEFPSRAGEIFDVRGGTAVAETGWTENENKNTIYWRSPFLCYSNFPSFFLQTHFHKEEEQFRIQEG